MSFSVLGWGSGGEGLKELAIPDGAAVVGASVNSEYNDIAFDKQNPNKFCLVYDDKDNSNYGTAVIGTISGNAISFGTPVVFNSGTCQYYINVESSPHEGDKYIIACQASEPGGTWTGMGFLLTVSGTTITVADAEKFIDTYYCDEVQMCLDPHTDGRFFVGFRNNVSNTNRAHLVVGSWSGTTLSFGSVQVVGRAITSGHSAGNPNVHLAADPHTDNKVLLGYSDYGAATYDLWIHICTISGTSISADSGTDMNDTNPTSEATILFNKDTSGKFYSYYNSDGGNTRVQVHTYNGSSMTAIGSVQEIVDHRTPNQVVENPLDATQHLMFYKEETTNDGKLAIIDYSGDTASVTTTYTMHGNVYNSLGICFDGLTEGRFMVSYKDVDNSNYPTARLGQLAQTGATPPTKHSSY